MPTLLLAVPPYEQASFRSLLALVKGSSSSSSRWRWWRWWMDGTQEEEVGFCRSSLVTRHCLWCRRWALVGRCTPADVLVTGPVTSTTPIISVQSTVHLCCSVGSVESRFPNSYCISQTSTNQRYDKNITNAPTRDGVVPFLLGPDPPATLSSRRGQGGRRSGRYFVSLCEQSRAKLFNDHVIMTSCVTF
jgi:hypothetical protein